MKRLAAVLFIMVLLVGCVSQTTAPTQGDNKRPPQPQVVVSEEAAVTLANMQDGRASVEGWDKWQVRLAENLELEVDGRKTIYTTWVVEASHKSGTKLVVYVDATVNPPKVLRIDRTPSESTNTRLDQHIPIKLELTDYRGASRDLLANPDRAVNAGLRALGGQIDYPSPPIRPTPGYEITLRGPNGEEAVLSYVGKGNWQIGPQFVEGKALADAVVNALTIPLRHAGDLEYLFAATELKVSQNNMNIPDETWNRRRHVVVRVLRELGDPQTEARIPQEEPLKLLFTIGDQTERVEVWVNAFRYSGRVYHAEGILRMLGSSMAAG